jgi:HD-GYP domain-containing protein (c-di-GMP phosphodiesterase class II)
VASLRARVARLERQHAERQGHLFKPAPLTEDEMRLVRMHPLTGSAILRHVDFLDEAASVVRHHHERWDGGGYPDRLEGDAIPLPARVFAVADTLDALTSTRPYREQVSFAEARRRIVAEAGSQFDRTIVAAYETVPDEAFERIRDGLA